MDGGPQDPGGERATGPFGVVGERTTGPFAAVGRQFTLEEVVGLTRDGVVEPPQVQGRTIMLSSGTTGRPKGARRRPRPGMWPLASMLSRIPLRARQTMIVEAPLFHTWGYAAMQMAYALRCPIVLRRRFDPEETLRAVAEHRNPVVFAVPVMAQRIMDLPEEVRGRYDTSRLRLMALSGSGLPGDLALRFMDAFGDRLYSVYGTTEASWVAIAGPRELRRDPATAGRPPRNTSLAILDDLGLPVQPGEIGRIYAANELLFEGYTSGAPMEVRDGLLRTGDLGHIENGLLYVDGREDGLVVSGGENVVPRDVEDAIARLPGVREVAVVGVPDAEWGQRPAAYIVAEPWAGLDADTVRSHVHDQLARYAVPRDVHFLSELPRNATGKIVHRWLDSAVQGEVPEGLTGWPLPVAEAGARRA
ncbi:AMP-binding protein [Thermomonospora umbrina]|uniref:AMP-binding protein n=1 Tax=Thermomonospora umbrina TaxID=111806 RepID=UPI001FEA75D5|nr:AMP-binding protein [Thermomonospora umbrina]